MDESIATKILNHLGQTEEQILARRDPKWDRKLRAGKLMPPAVPMPLPVNGPRS